MTSYPCELTGCVEPAYCVIHAQWTIFDCLDLAVCYEHQELGWNWLRRRRVDGQLPVDQFVIWARPWRETFAEHDTLEDLPL